MEDPISGMAAERRSGIPCILAPELFSRGSQRVRHRRPTSVTHIIRALEEFDSNGLEHHSTLAHIHTHINAVPTPRCSNTVWKGGGVGGKEEVGDGGEEVKKGGGGRGDFMSLEKMSSSSLL